MLCRTFLRLSVDRVDAGKEPQNLKIANRVLTPPREHFEARRKLFCAIVVFAALSLMIGACSSDDGGNDAGSTATTGATTQSSSGETTGATGTTSATGATTATGATGPASSNTGGSGATGATGGLGSITDLTGLESFRWDVTMKGAGSFFDSSLPSVPGAENTDITAQGAYIAPDQAQVTVQLAGFEYKQTVKGDQEWTTIAGVTTGPIPATSNAQDLIYVSSFVDPESYVDGESMQCGDSEDVNGVQAVRCETTEEVNQQIVDSLAGQGAQTSDASFVVWVSQDREYITRWEFNATGTANNEPFQWNFVANITDVDNVQSIEP